MLGFWHRSLRRALLISFNPCRSRRATQPWSARRCPSRDACDSKPCVGRYNCAVPTSSHLTCYFETPCLGAPPVLSRVEAAARGFTRFCTGLPCKEGHFAERFVSNRQCVTCNAAKARQRECIRGRRDPSHRMFRNVLRRTGQALKGRASPARVLGCDHPVLHDYIVDRFRPGMSWERYRQWEVDHVRPLSAARTHGELIELCHFSNLQPLWRRENLVKGGALDRRGVR